MPRVTSVRLPNLLCGLLAGRPCRAECLRMKDPHGGVLVRAKRISSDALGLDSLSPASRAEPWAGAPPIGKCSTRPPTLSGWAGSCETQTMPHPVLLRWLCVGGGGGVQVEARGRTTRSEGGKTSVTDHSTATQRHSATVARWHGGIARMGTCIHQELSGAGHRARCAGRRVRSDTDEGTDKGTNE